MKKLLILIAILTAYSNIFASLTQGHWRWRNDDGSETTASWKAGENTFISLISSSEIFRLRIEIYSNTGDPDPVGVFDTLQYATSTAGPWKNLDTLAGSNPFMIATTSAFVTQNQLTTAQLTGGAFTFVPGKIMVDSMVLKNYFILDQQRTEFEWVIRGTQNLLPNTTYYFRHWGSTAITPLPVGTTYPSLSTATVLPIKLNSFLLNREDKKIKLEWVTTSEQNNSRFEIERSGDGRSWQTIADIQGHGTITGTNTYTTYDESPLNGINYYVIRQYDADGHYYLSDVKFLRINKDRKSIVLISPNPTSSGINFILTDQTVSNVEATLTGINGQTVHHEIVKSVQANDVNKLNLRQQPVPGMYILKLRANGLSKSIKVIIE